MRHKGFRVACECFMNKTINIVVSSDGTSSPV